MATLALAGTLPSDVEYFNRLDSDEMLMVIKILISTFDFSLIYKIGVILMHLRREELRLNCLVRIIACSCVLDHAISFTFVCLL